MSGDGRALRRGWSTGACAAAAAAAAWEGLLAGACPDSVTVTLPGGRRPAFEVATDRVGAGVAAAGVVKDAGDDPDVTHGALVVATVRSGEPGTGVAFRAGSGVGTVTLPGLPLAVGEPAINPVPRRMIGQAIGKLATAHGRAADAIVELAVEGGEELAARTWNPRLGIVGGLSILGTTGIVVPYSCSAWIASIRQGVDVARASGQRHAVAATGSTSEQAAVERYGVPATAVLDMGDFAGALLRYLARHPIERLTLAGGFAKLSKLAAGHLDLHSARSQVDLERLAAAVRELGGGERLGAEVAAANTAMHALELAQGEGVDLAGWVARAAHAIAGGVLAAAPVGLDVLVVDRDGRILAECGAAAATGAGG